MLSIRRLLLVALLLGLLAACGTPPSSGGGEAVSFTLNLTPGQRFRVQTSSDQDISAMSGAMEIEQEMLLIYGYEVLERTEDRYTISATYEYMEMTTRNGGMEQRVSTADDPATAVGMCLCVLEGMTLTMTVGYDGTIYEIEGKEQMVDRMLEGMGQDLSGEQLDYMSENLDQLLGSSFSSGNFQGFVPQEPVALNESWTATQEMAGMMSMVITTTYTLKAATAEEATLDVTSEVAPGSDPEPVMDLYTYELSGTQTGTLVIDRATGMPKSSVVYQNLDGTMTLLMGGDDQEVPMTIVSKVTTELLDPDAPLPTPRPTPEGGFEYGGKVEEVFEEINEGLDPGQSAPTLTPTP